MAVQWSVGRQPKVAKSNLAPQAWSPSGLSSSEIVGAAVALLDEHGLAAFSMRTLAAHLGRSTMATYRHVASREELLQLAADAVQEEPMDLVDRPWFERLEVLARHGWKTSWSQHPWIVDVFGREQNLTPRTERRLEIMRSIFRDAGFDADQVEHALFAHWSFVVGGLRLITSVRLAEGRDPRVSTPADDAVFEFNLRTSILGLSAMAADASPGMLSRNQPPEPQHGPKKKRVDRRPGRQHQSSE